MILAGIVMLTGIILEIIFHKIDWEGSLLVGFAGASLFVALFFPAAGLIDSSGYVYEEKVTLQEQIYSLEALSSAHGSFVLGVGSFDTEAKYYFYTKDEYGGLKLKSINSSVCTIIETEKVQPSIKEIQKKPVGYKDTFYKIMYWPVTRLPEYHYILYVPPNTVKQVYSANMGNQ